MTKEEIQKRVLELSKNEEWNHLYVLSHGIKTRQREINSPGFNTFKWARLEKIVKSLNPKDKQFLDLGCSDGYFSVQCANLGAKHVYGIDPDPLRIERANFVKEVYQMNNVDYEVEDLYNLKEEKKYDIILALGLLHRIPNLELCLEKMSKVGRSMVLEFKTLNDEREIFEEKGGKTKSNIYNGLYKIPTVNYVKSILNKLNFSVDNTYYDTNSDLRYKRTIMVASETKNEK